MNDQSTCVRRFSRQIEVGVHNRRPSKLEPYSSPTKQFADFPAETLLVPDPVLPRVAVGRSGAFWLTFHVRHGTPVGIHRGKIRVQPASRPARQFDLAVQVRPFDLSRPRIAFGEYFPFWGVPEFAKTGTWKAAVYKDMADHGATSVDLRLYSVLGDRNGELVPEGVTALAGQIDAGIRSGLLHANTPVWIGEIRAIPLPNVRNFGTQLQAETLKREWPQILYYFSDEPPYPVPPAPNPYSDVRQRGAAWRDSPVGRVTAMGGHAAVSSSTRTAATCISGRCPRRCPTFTRLWTRWRERA